MYHSNGGQECKTNVVGEACLKIPTAKNPCNAARSRITNSQHVCPDACDAVKIRSKHDHELMQSCGCILVLIKKTEKVNQHILLKKKSTKIENDFRGNWN